MEKNGAAVTLYARPLVVVRRNDHIIGLIPPPERLVSLARRQRNHAVILAMADVFTPGLGWFADLDPEARPGPGKAVCPKVDILQVPYANRTCTVAFALAVTAATSAQQAGKSRLADRQPA